MNKKEKGLSMLNKKKFLLSFIFIFIFIFSYSNWHRTLGFGPIDGSLYTCNEKNDEIPHKHHHQHESQDDLDIRQIQVDRSIVPHAQTCARIIKHRMHKRQLLAGWIAGAVDV